MTFSLHQGGVVMSSQIIHTLSSTYTPQPTYVLDICVLIFSSCDLFTVYPNAHHVIASHPSPCDNHQCTGGR